MTTKYSARPNASAGWLAAMRTLLLVLAGLLCVGLSSCFSAFTPADTGSARGVEQALLASDLGVSEAKATSEVSGFGRSMLVDVTIARTEVSADELLDFLAVIAAQTGPSQQELVVTFWDPQSEIITLPVPELNDRWRSSHGTEKLFWEASGDATNAEARVQLDSLNQFLEEQGR